MANIKNGAVIAPGQVWGSPTAYPRTILALHRDGEVSVRYRDKDREVTITRSSFRSWIHRNGCRVQQTSDGAGETESK